MRRIIQYINCILLLMALNGCLMMPVMMTPFMHESIMKHEKKEKVNNIDIIKELIVESIADINDLQGQFEKLYLGNIETDSKLISIKETKRILLNSSQKTQLNIIEQKMPKKLDKTSMIEAKIDIRIFKENEKLWLENNIVDIHTDKILWSKIYSRSTSSKMD